jgi:hypothetical protein
MLPTFIPQADGSVIINKTKRHVRSFWVLGDPKTVALAGAGAPGDEVIGVPFMVDTQGHFEWAYLMSVATSKNFLVKIFDPGTRRDLMNNYIHAATLLGTAQRPGLLVETYLLNTENAGRELDISVKNLSMAPNDVEVALHGRRWYHLESPPDVQADIRNKFKQRERTTAYWLTPDGGPGFTVAGGASLVNNDSPLFVADDEADTEVFKVTAFASEGVGSFEFRLRELASNRFLMNEFVRMENGWGTAEFPFVFQESLLIERNYKVAVEINNLSMNPNTIFLTFWCRRLWYR